MNEQLIVFALGEQRYALRLAAVDRVVRAVAISPLPQAPGIVLGLINVRGRIIPIIDMRLRFSLPQRTIALTDQIVIAHTMRRAVGLVVDGVANIIAYPTQSMAAAQDILPGMSYIEGVMKLPDGLVLIHDLEQFLSLEEEIALARALATT
jgi:purine-binding chemotaxis protein CheW